MDQFLGQFFSSIVKGWFLLIIILIIVWFTLSRNRKFGIFLIGAFILATVLLLAINTVGVKSLTASGNCSFLIGPNASKCYTEKAVKYNDYAFCKKASFNQNECYLQLSRSASNLDLKICENVKPSEGRRTEKDECGFNIIQKNKQYQTKEILDEICRNMDTLDYRGMCLNFALRTTKDIYFYNTAIKEICDEYKKTSSYSYSNCIQNYVSDLTFDFFNENNIKNLKFYNDEDLIIIKFCRPGGTKMQCFGSSGKKIDIIRNMDLTPVLQHCKEAFSSESEINKCMIESIEGAEVRSGF